MEVVVAPDRPAARPPRRGRRSRSAPTSPELPARPRARRSRTDPAAAGPLTVDRGRVHSGPAAAALRRASTTAPRAEALRGRRCSSPTSTRTSGPRTPTSSTTTSWSACAVRTVDGDARRRGRRGAAPARPGPARRAARRTAREVLVPFVAEHRARGRPRRRAGRRRPAARAARRRDAASRPSRRAGDCMRVDVVTIFPDYLAPLRLSLIGRAARRRAARRARPRPARLDRTTGTAPSTTPRTAAAPAW